MSVTMSFKYWDDCVDAEDMEEMWMDPRVSEEWISVGETKGRSVHLSRDPDGQVYLTQTEMKVSHQISEFCFLFRVPPIGRHAFSSIDDVLLYRLHVYLPIKFEIPREIERKPAWLGSLGWLKLA